jgi:hypothetical protein
MTHPETLNLAQFAKHIGCKRNYASQLKAEGRLVMTAEGRVNVAQSIERIAATRDPSKAGVAERHARQRGGVVQTGHEVGHQVGQVGQPAAAAPPAPPAEDQPQGDGNHYHYQDAKAKREHWAAEREKALYLKESGELMERSQVVATFAHAGATIRQKLEAWSSVLPPQLEGRDETAMRTTLAEQVEQVLADLAQSFARMSEEG